LRTTAIGSGELYKDNRRKALQNALTGTEKIETIEHENYI
jgi:hypothetical protein